MRSIVIAPVGDDNSAIFHGIREFSTEKVVLFSTPRYEDKAQKLQNDLKKFKIPSSVINLEGNLWESMFKSIADIKSSGKDIMINVGSADPAMKCISISAAFVNGLKAFDVHKNKISLLPVMKFSYYRMIPEKKMRILKLLHSEADCCASLEEISKRLKISLPLVSYHINGNIKSEGLKQMGLVDTESKKGRISIKLSTLGRLIIKGYVN
jgi:DNA-binding transcriptional ArsR family regulator